MTEIEAIRRANAFLFQDRGITAEPVQVVLVPAVDEPSYWVVRYGTSILFPKETAAGCKVDDGDYILAVDDSSGVVTVMR